MLLQPTSPLMLLFNLIKQVLPSRQQQQACPP
jgi:hypothetical protein